MTRNRHFKQVYHDVTHQSRQNASGLASSSFPSLGRGRLGGFILCAYQYQPTDKTTRTRVVLDLSPDSSVRLRLLEEVSVPLSSRSLPLQFQNMLQDQENIGFHGLPEDALDEVLQSRDTRMVRPAWAPVWSYQPSGRPQASKFGGSEPYRRPGFVWPRCTDCHEQMTFMCQLEAKTLPEKAKELAMFHSGLLQVFYCKCDPIGQEFEGLWVVPEDEYESVPSMLSLAASAVKKNGSIPSDCLPAPLE